MIIRATVRNSHQELGLPTDTKAIDEELDSANKEVMLLAFTIYDTMVEEWKMRNPHLLKPCGETRTTFAAHAILGAQDHVIEKRYSQPIREKHRAEGADPMLDEWFVVDGAKFWEKYGKDLGN